MQSSTLEFPRNARTVYTAVKSVVQTCGRFSNVRGNDGTFIVTASHGASLFSLGENVRMRVVATGTESAKVVIESSSKVFLNFINGGANKKNVQALADYIANAVWRLLDVSYYDGREHSTIRIVQPEIKMKK